MTEETRKFIIERLGKIPQVLIAKQAGVSNALVTKVKKEHEGGLFDVPYDSRRAASRRGGRRKYG